MSEFKTPLTTITAILPHSNADRLQIAKVYDFNVIIPSGKYSVGDTVLYTPIDSILTQELEDFIFPADSKIKLNNGRIRQIKIRQLYSQGMLISAEDVKTFAKIEILPPLETDMSSILGITKYEPPAPDWQGSSTGVTKTRTKPLENPLFHKYNGVENLKWYSNLFEEGVEEVVLQEKLHGSNIRVSYLPVYVPTVSDIKKSFETFKKVFAEHKRFRQRVNNVRGFTLTTLSMFKKMLLSKLGRMETHEYGYGSNNVELTNKVGYTGYYGSDIYGAVLEKVKAFDKIRKNETIFGELIGKGIQKNYDYGHTDHHHFVMFGVKVLQPDNTQKWLEPDEAENYAKERGFDFVPILYKGPYNKDMAYELSKGASIYCPAQKVREGLVVKSRYDYNNSIMPSAKKEAKIINEAYLDDKHNTDNH